MTVPAQRLLLFCGGLCGALGVGLSAVASHAGGANLGTAASMLLAHAPALLVLSLLRSRLATIGGYGLAAGLALFCGDLVMRDLAGHRLFPFAAPAGGSILIIAWLLVATSAFGSARRSQTGSS